MLVDGRAPEDDDRLLARIARGDREAYARLVERHLDRTVAVAQRVLGDRAAAEDVAQDVFLRVWTHAADWRPGRAKFGTWIYRVTVNRCLDVKRRPAHTGLDAAGEPVDTSAGALDALADRRRRAALDRAIADLPERQRTAIALCYTAGLSNAEAAETMGLGIGAVESLLVRAKRALRRRLPAELW